MSTIVFFCIPAHGHTNPTAALVRELVSRGHRVRYYSFAPFQEKLEAAGAEFIACDAYMPPLPRHSEQSVSKDFSALLTMTAEVTLAMEQDVLSALSTDRPDCVVADSLCIWGKLYAKRLGLPLICSTTSFAFNQYTARRMKQSCSEILLLLLGLPAIQRQTRRLRRAGYAIDSFLSLIQNDNNTPTIVYTSKLFQPQAETFSEQYTFAGPCLDLEALPQTKDAAGFPGTSQRRKLLYISLGTVNYRSLNFYRSCIEAFRGCDLDVIMAVGSDAMREALTDAPAHFQIYTRVPQLEVLRQADVFLTHCGMNSVNESLYFSVPMVLCPQQSEQGAVADRVLELGAGIKPKDLSAAGLRQAVLHVLKQPSFREHAALLAESFHKAGGAPTAADAIEHEIPHSDR